MEIGHNHLQSVTVAGHWPANDKSVVDDDAETNDPDHDKLESHNNAEAKL